MKNRVFFLPENFQFLEVKFSIYLNRRVFVMVKLFLSIFFTTILWFISDSQIYSSRICSLMKDAVNITWVFYPMWVVKYYVYTRILMNDHFEDTHLFVLYMFLQESCSKYNMGILPYVSGQVLYVYVYINEHTFRRHAFIPPCICSFKKAAVNIT